MTLSNIAPDFFKSAGDLLKRRGVRLVVYLVIAAILLPSARFILLISALLPLGVFAYKERMRSAYISADS